MKNRLVYRSFELTQNVVKGCGFFCPKLFNRIAKGLACLRRLCCRLRKGLQINLALRGQSQLQSPMFFLKLSDEPKCCFDEIQLLFLIL